MLSLAVTLAALAATAQGAYAQNNSKNPTGPQEQPGPFGFPGPKSMTEKLKLNQDQVTALLVIYGKYKKIEHQIQQANAQAKTNPNGANNASNSGLPDAGTAKGNMIMEIRMILVTDEQKTLFQQLVDDMGKKKKKGT
ncbi:MAG TPA: hypothetical protein VEN81_12225 [Planctomycetota bacterium]|nr:hypothetical protein [Planctomycetota bacterium]